MDWLGLCVLAFLAGLVDSMAGGGGLIQLPALFLFLPETLSNSVALVLGTNKFASICGTGLAAARYSRHIALPWRTVIPASVSAILIFASQHQILYHYAIPMGLCNIAGAYVGTHWVMQKGNRLIRVVFLIVVTSLILKMSWDTFWLQARSH